MRLERKSKAIVIDVMANIEFSGSGNPTDQKENSYLHTHCSETSQFQGQTEKS